MNYTGCHHGCTMDTSLHTFERKEHFTECMYSWICQVEDRKDLMLWHYSAAHLDVGVLFSEIPAGACDGSSSAHTSHQYIDLMTRRETSQRTAPL